MELLCRAVVQEDSIVHTHNLHAQGAPGYHRSRDEPVSQEELQRWLHRQHDSEHADEHMQRSLKTTCRYNFVPEAGLPHKRHPACIDLSRIHLPITIQPAVSGCMHG